MNRSGWAGWWVLVSFSAWASPWVPQTPLPGRSIPKFEQKMPVFGPEAPADLPRVTAADVVVRLRQVEQQVLPGGFPKTRIWAYQVESPGGTVLGPAHWPAVSLEASRGTPTRVRYVNELPPGDPDALDPTDPAFSLQALLPVDPTVHWADPTGLDCLQSGSEACGTPYLGPVPAVAHLHGGEVPSAYDGGPNAWWTPGFEATGSGFVTDTYVYSNDQEAGTLWFHDHALGITRLNVYGGLAAFYLLRDPANEPAGLPSGRFEVELAIQDRNFDTAGQLFFPAVGINPEHPFWGPEFLGDTIVVNGVTWPYLNVEARRYRLRVLNGSNARFYDLRFGTAPVFQIGGDDNYLDAPVSRASVLLAPGERADLIVDFSGLEGRTLLVRNFARAPYPLGAPPHPQTVGQIMQLRVVPAIGADTSCDPAAGECTRPTPLVRLATNGAIAQGVQVDRVRRLTLNEVMGPGGPLEILLNNTGFIGETSELPRVGSTELWEIVNLTADTHPIHFHLVQGQVLNRQQLQLNPYLKAYGASFPSGSYTPEVGPPLEYDDGETVTLQGVEVPVVGGNPDPTPYLLGPARAAPPEESGWKDTMRAHRGEVLRVLLRWAPTDAPATGAACPASNPVPAASRPCRPVPGSNLFSFDPTAGITEPVTYDFGGNPGGPGYVWHCHIIDHEDNEMMRPYAVLP